MKRTGGILNDSSSEIKAFLNSKGESAVEKSFEFSQVNLHQLYAFSGMFFFQLERC